MVDNSTSSETDIPNGEGLSYSPKVYTDPKYAATLPQTETNCSASEAAQKNFVGEYCAKCIRKHNRCWCNGSDWDTDLVDIEPPNSPDTNPSNTTNITKRLNSLKQVSIRQPPPGWPKCRNGATNKSNKAQMDNGQRNNGSLMDEIPIDKIIIKGFRSVSQKEFDDM